MVEQQQYIAAGLPHQGGLTGPHGLPEERPSASTTTSGYSEVPFSTVTSFNLPAHCDSSLLTPISTAASPPLQQARKLARQYPPPPSTPYTQMPTPPGSSKMYPHQWSGQFDVNSQTSQASSPMNPQASVAPEFYIPDDRRTPGPPEPYFGAYGVSDNADVQPIHQPGPPYYMDMTAENQSNMLLRENQPLPMDRNAPPTPLLSQPQPSHYRPAPRRQSADDHSHGSYIDPPRRSPSDSPRHQALHRPTQGNTRVKKSRSSKRQTASARHQSQAVDPADEHKNCHGEEVPPILKDTCPPEERCIFDSRWRHRNQRGQDMWDSIQADYSRQFNKTPPGKEMLQMKFKRGRSKYVQWLTKDEELLREAWRKMEADRYQILNNIFLELGGSRNMLLSPSDIEIKVVNDLKFEESVYIEGTDLDIRRRRRAVGKKRSNARGEHAADVITDEMLAFDHGPSHNEDEVINQAYSRRDAARWEEEESTNNEMMDVQMWDSRAPMKMEPGVMIQPGDQILKAHHNNPNVMQNGQPTGGPAAHTIYQRRKAA